MGLPKLQAVLTFSAIFATAMFDIHVADGRYLVQNVYESAPETEKMVAVSNITLRLPDGRLAHGFKRVTTYITKWNSTAEYIRPHHLFPTNLTSSLAEMPSGSNDTVAFLENSEAPSPETTSFVIGDLSPELKLDLLSLVNQTTYKVAADLDKKADTERETTVELILDDGEEHKLSTSNGTEASSNSTMVDAKFNEIDDEDNDIEIDVVLAPSAVSEEVETTETPKTSTDQHLKPIPGSPIPDSVDDLQSSNDFHPGLNSEKRLEPTASADQDDIQVIDSPKLPVPIIILSSKRKRPQVTHPSAPGPSEDMPIRRLSSLESSQALNSEDVTAPLDLNLTDTAKLTPASSTTSGEASPMQRFMEGVISTVDDILQVPLSLLEPPSSVTVQRSRIRPNSFPEPQTLSRVPGLLRPRVSMPPPPRSFFRLPILPPPAAGSPSLWSVNGNTVVHRLPVIENPLGRIAPSLERIHHVLNYDWHGNDRFRFGQWRWDMPLPRPFP